MWFISQSKQLLAKNQKKLYSFDLNTMAQTKSSRVSAYQFEEIITELEDAAERLDQDATQYDGVEASPGAMVEAAKKIAGMWMKMAQLIRKECVLKERRFKEEIVDLAKSINKESQVVVRIATSTAEACTDRTMKNAVSGVVERMLMISHQLRILAAGEASRQRDEASDLEACRLITDNATNLTTTISQTLYHTQSASLRVSMATRKELGLTHIAETESISGKHHKVRGDRSREGNHYQDSHQESRGHTPPQSSSSSTKERDILQIPEASKEGYNCVAQNSLCIVYLPQEISEKLSIETVTDTSIHPKIASNEIFITPVVCITFENTSMSLEKPAIIELAKTVELSDKEANNKVIPLCADSESSEWKELGSECNCRVLKDLISFQVTHFYGLYAVISRKPYPSSTVRVKPAASADISAPGQPSTPTELTIPELPGFRVQIPPSSINAVRETDITATILYDCSAVCSEDDRSWLASSCIELEPHGIVFTKKVTVSLPIPDYAEVMKNDPDAQLQIFWHSSSRSTDEERNELVEHYILQDEEGRYIAVVQTDHFSWLKALWRSTEAHVKKLLKHMFNIKGSATSTEISSTSKDKTEGDKSFVPTGHILTKQELEVVSTLLAPYTDERLKELQLSIEKKQEGGISREEVEVLLRQSGLTMTADRLKDNIEKAPSGSPGGLSVKYKLPTVAELSWSPVSVEKQNGIITGYTVKIVGPDSPWEIPVQGAGTTSVEIPRLRPFTSYTFNVSAMTKAGTGPATTISAITPEGAPSVAPGGINISHKLPTMAELSWSPIPEEKQNGVITAYRVEVVGPDSPGGISVQGADTTYVEIPGLRSFTSYTFNISAMTKAGTGPAATISSKTLEGAPSGSPGGLSVKYKLPTVAELYWSPVPPEKRNGIITGYTVKIVGPNSPWEILVQDAGTTTIEIPRLRPFTSYTFNVSGMTKAGTGPATTISATTPEGAPSGSPGGLRVNHSLPTTAKLSWTPVSKDKRNGIITGYTVQVMGTDSTSKQEILVDKADVTSVEISNLTPFTSYNFSISAKTKASSGPVATISSRTPEAAPSECPGDIRVHHRLPTTAKLSWKPVPNKKLNGIIIGYTVEVRGPDSGFVQEVRVKEGDASFVEITDLIPSTPYDFLVSAKTKAGSGPAASISSQTPEIGGSLQPQEVQIEGYSCIARSDVGYVYLPEYMQLTNITAEIQSVNNTTLYPKIKVNEVIIAPVVCITLNKTVQSSDKPIIIELKRIDEYKSDHQLVPLFCNVIADQPDSPNWQELGEAAECTELTDTSSIRFKTTQLSYFTVIARFSPPTTSKIIEPQFNESNPILITIPELQQFKVEIPSNSVTSVTEIKATLYSNCYDPEVCKESTSKEPLATACVQLDSEPPGQKFATKIAVQLPIPGYSAIMKKYPDSKLKAWYAPSSQGGLPINWNSYNDPDFRVVEIAEGEFVAEFFTDHFSWWKLTWSEVKSDIKDFSKKIFKYVNTMKGRCQVFMTRESFEKSTVNFCIQVVVSHFHKCDYKPNNYHYTLYDSGTIHPIRLISGKQHFLLQLSKSLGQNDNQICEKSDELSTEIPARAEFDLQLQVDKCKFSDDILVGTLVIREDKESKSYFNLIKSSSELPTNLLNPEQQIVTVYLPSLIDTDKLKCDKHLNEIQAYLSCVRFKWFQIGRALEVKYDTLEVIRRNNPHDEDNCYIQMLVNWLRNHPAPCWKVLAEALRSDLVNGVIVKEINEAHDDKSEAVDANENRHKVASTSELIESNDVSSDEAVKQNIDVESEVQPTSSWCTWFVLGIIVLSVAGSIIILRKTMKR